MPIGSRVHTHSATATTMTWTTNGTARISPPPPG
jgi:hypothetical protein